MRRPTLSALTVSLLVASTLFLMSNSSGVAHQQNKTEPVRRAVTTRASNVMRAAITILISKSIWLFHWEGGR